MVELDRLRGITMDHGYGLSLLPHPGGTLQGRCESCTTVQQVADDDVAVISRSGLEGLLVVPRLHVRGLEELPVPHRANVLAAVQRAKRTVGSEKPWSAPRIVVMTDLPASEGHLCIHVLPSEGEAVDATPQVRAARGRVPVD